MFMQQGNQMANRGGFNQAQNVLQGPLAYLEKTTSNIGTVLAELQYFECDLHFDVCFLYRSCRHGRWPKVTRAGQGARQRPW